MEVIINEGNYKDKLATSRKVCSFLSKKLGMSKNDLSPLLKSKFDGLTNPSSAVKILGWNFQFSGPFPIWKAVSATDSIWLKFKS